METSISDECTFLYTSEYYMNGAPTALGWSTEWATIKFPGCQ